MAEKIMSVERMLHIFLEGVEALKANPEALVFTPEEIKKIAKLKPPDLEFDVSPHHHEINFLSGEDGNPGDEVIFKKLATGIRKIDTNGEVDYDDINDLVSNYN